MSSQITAIERSESPTRGIQDFPVFGMTKRFETTPATGEEAMRMSDLDFEVEKRPICVEVKNDQGEVVDMVRSDKHFAMVRSDTNAIFGPVGRRYEKADNCQAFSFMDNLAGSGQIKYLAAGAMNGGARICLWAEVPHLTFDAKPGDAVKAMIILSLSHDGTASIMAALLAARYACFNLNPTLKSAVRGGNGVSIRHSGDIQAKLEQASRVMSIVSKEMEQYKEQALHLADQRVNRGFVRAFLDHLIPMPEDGSERSTRSQNQWDLLYRLCDSGRGTEIPGVRGTRWGLLNALTEWLNHERSRALETRMNSLFFGTSGQLNQKGFHFLMEASQNGEMP